MSLTSIACDPLGWVSVCCTRERCALCGQPAYSKVVEQIFFDDASVSRHALSAYVCAWHFRQLMGEAAVAWLEESRAQQCAASAEE